MSRKWGVTSRIAGSTNKGEVIVNAANAHVLAAAIGQQKALIFRSDRISSGGTAKKAPHTSEISQRPTAIKAKRTWANPLKEKAAHNPKTTSRRKNGLKRSGRKMEAGAATFQSLDQNSPIEAERMGDRIKAGALIPINLVGQSWLAVAISARARMIIPPASQRMSRQELTADTNLTQSNANAKTAVPAMNTSSDEASMLRPRRSILAVPLHEKNQPNRSRKLEVDGANEVAVAMVRGNAKQHISKPRASDDAHKKQGTAKNKPAASNPKRAVIGFSERIKMRVISANQAAIPTGSDMAGV